MNSTLFDFGPVDKICVWVNANQKNQTHVVNARFWLNENQFAFDFSDLRSDVNLMQRGLYLFVCSVVRFLCWYYEGKGMQTYITIAQVLATRITDEHIYNKTTQIGLFNVWHTH